MRKTSERDEYGVADLLSQAASTDDPDLRAALRQETIERLLPLAEHVARRFAGRGEPFDDLVQVARVGVVNAVDRFDPTVGAEFLSFAVPTVMGEVRRYFRDNTWSIRVNRRAKDVAQAIARGTDELIQSLGRSPRPSELAAHLDLPVADVIDGLLARSAHSASSLDSPVADGEDGRSLAETLGSEDREMTRIDDFVTLQPAMEDLPERERTIVALRFFEAKSQSEIAAELGISQMHVSRLLSATLRKLREAVASDPPPDLN